MDSKSPGIPREDDAVAVGDASILVLDQVLNGFNNGYSVKLAGATTLIIF
jgi:hypothetical protein